MAGVCYYLNSCVNPVLYSVMSTRFRAAFSLYVSDFCSHSTMTTTVAGSTRASARVSRHRPPDSDQSRSDGRHSGVFSSPAVTAAHNAPPGTMTATAVLATGTTTPLPEVHNNKAKNYQYFQS